MNKKVSGEEKASIVRALEQGDRYPLDLGGPSKIYLVARPEKDTVELKNALGKLVRHTTADDRARMARNR